jgi:DNA polymerase I-like protein with 3'-5' exonuclease and polymerase domains
MAKIVSLEEAQSLQGQLRSWAYCALDTTGTREIADTLLPRLTPAQLRIYNFEKAQQGPAVAMMLRGVSVDVPKRAAMVAGLRREQVKDQRDLQKLPGILGVWDQMEKDTGFCAAELGKKHNWTPRGGDPKEQTCKRCEKPRLKLKPFNPGSSQQKQYLFYKLHKIPPMRNKTGEISTDDDVLDRIGKKYEHLTHITDAIRALQDKQKQLGTLNGKLTSANRYPSSFNVGAAWTGRFSSSKNPFGLGGNLQNISERHRATFVADPGMLIGYADLKQAESNAVAHYAGDEKYIEAHRVGDVHTYVTRLVWPEMGWTGDIKQDKKIAKQLPEWDNVEGHDFRFQSKRIQHGSNFGLSPPGISMIAKIPQKNAREAQANYFQAFPMIRGWQQQDIGVAVREHRPLVNAMGREIILMGRPNDPHTFKQGLAFKPQSVVADILNLSMVLVFLHLEPEGVQLLAQIHDALLFQFPEDRLDLAIKTAHMMKIAVPIGPRVMEIETELAVGKNWGHASEDNPNGLKEIDI